MIFCNKKNRIWYMRLITLNLLCGRMREPLADFLKKYADKADIFLFQEMPETGGDNETRLSSDGIKNILSDFKNYSKDFSISGGHLDDLGLFVKRKVNVSESGEAETYDANIFNDRMVYVWRDLGYVVLDDKKLFVNFHGFWDGPDKFDRPRRIEQSRRVSAFLGKYDGPKILAGDFNLWPETESLRMLEKNMINLISKYKISSTRPPDWKFSNKFSDYIFISSDIVVNDFRVLPDIVSDHLALYLDFD